MSQKILFTDKHTTITEYGDQIQILVKSPMNPRKEVMNLPATLFTKVEKYLNGNELIQVILPMLTPDEREYFISGIPVGKWDQSVRKM